jgi:cell division protein FtsL
MTQTRKASCAANKLSIAILASVLVVLFAFYVFLSIHIATSQHRIELAQEKVRDAQRINNILKVQLADISSLEYILERSSEIAYVEIKNVSYFTKSSETSLAQR